MSLKEPQSMDECVYFTNRELANEGYIKAWVFKEDCPECKKSKMGKPINPKTGKAKIRAKEYECVSCGHKEEKENYENTLTCNVKYKCPYCRNEDETQIPFLRKKVTRFNEEKGKRESVEGVIFNCSKCEKRIEITKKMK